MYAVAENYLDRDFYATRPAEKWVSDLTYIRIGEGWLYLTVALALAVSKQNTAVRQTALACLLRQDAVK